MSLGGRRPTHVRRLHCKGTQRVGMLPQGSCRSPRASGLWPAGCTHGRQDHPGGAGQGPCRRHRPWLGCVRSLPSMAAPWGPPPHPAGLGLVPQAPAPQPGWLMGRCAPQARQDLDARRADPFAAAPAAAGASMGRLELWKGCLRSRCPCLARQPLGAALPAPGGPRCPPHWHQGWDTCAGRLPAENLAGRWPSCRAGANVCGPW